MTSKNYCIVMDDETYCKLDFLQLPGHHYYSGKDRKSVDDQFKTIKTEKFAKKVLVWQAICSCGTRSKPFISSTSMNGEIYLKQCIQKLLLPLIMAHNVPVLFWPNLATCHYTKNSVEWYRTNNMDLVEKIENPPNCPELRPIEKYWSLMKQKLQKYKNPAKSVDDFKYKWKTATQMVTDETVQKLMEGVKRKVRKFWMEASKVLKIFCILLRI